jgi:hypothetical protein
MYYFICSVPEIKEMPKLAQMKQESKLSLIKKEKTPSVSPGK